MYNSSCSRRGFPQRIKNYLVTGMLMGTLALNPIYQLFASDNGGQAGRKKLTPKMVWETVFNKDFGGQKIIPSGVVQESELMEPAEVRKNALNLMNSKKYHREVKATLDIDHESFSHAITNDPAHVPETLAKVVNYMFGLEGEKCYQVELNSMLSDSNGVHGFEYSGEKDDVGGRFWFLDAGEGNMIVYAEGRLNTMAIPGKALGVFSYYPNDGKTDVVMQSLIRSDYGIGPIDDTATFAMKTGTAIDKIGAGIIDIFTKKDIKGIVDSKINKLVTDANNAASGITVAKSDSLKWKNFMNGLEGTGNFSEMELEYIGELHDL
ncbi:MAG: hypothetical protein JW754_03085 [Candidatus Aenigmarchaeota archaeon]|nr:hypothetical protein [Candidatus Aenigmarchaeota archaeon]